MYKKIVIKIGTNVITKDDGFLDMGIMKNIVDQIVDLKNKGMEVVVVSSGAMGAGRSLINLQENGDKVGRRQVLAAIGQPKLMGVYENLFGKQNLVCAQVLATKEDFRDRQHYLNMRSCFSALLKQNIVPVVNENDVVSVDELMFTDNDELAGLIATMINAEALFLLTNVDGVLLEDRKVLDCVKSGSNVWKKTVAPNKKSKFGRGGMLTKCRVAEKLSTLGITTHIVNGKTKDIILEVAKGENMGTTFLPQTKKVSSVKKWVAENKGREKGTVVVNKCAVDVLTNKTKASSLLPVGVIKIEGEFEKGDVIRICDESSKQLGIGVAQYSSDVAKENMGKQKKKPVAHYDYLFLF